MYKKEYINTFKQFGLSLVLSLLTILFSFYLLKITITDKIKFAEIIFSTIEIIFLIIASYLGANLFGEEKSQDNFEYLFSLKYSRWELLMSKLIPRITVIGILLLLYTIPVLISEKYLLIRPNVFLYLLFLMFLFFASFSLLNKHNMFNTIINLLVFFISFGIIMFVIYYFSNLLPDTFNFKFIVSPLKIFTFFSISLFIVFVISFKKIDLSNYIFIFMKKNLIKLGLIYFAFLCLFILVNIFDSSQNTNLFTKKDLLPAKFETTNGFYKLLTLFELPDTDIESTKVINKYRCLFDTQVPQYKSQSSYTLWNLTSLQKHLIPYLKIINKNIDSKTFEWLKWPSNSSNLSWNAIIMSKKSSILKLTKELNVPLIRYQDMINSTQYTDLFTPKHTKLLWIYYKGLKIIGRLYIAEQIIDCHEGNWKRGINALLSHLNLQKKTIKESRTIMMNQMAKNSMKMTLRAIADLINNDKCPKEIFKLVYIGMPDLKYENFGSKNTLIADCLFFNKYMKNEIKEELNNNLKYFIYRLFLQENATENYIDKITKLSINFEQKEPFKVQDKDIKQKLKNEKEKFKGFLQLFYNPFGQMLIKKHWFYSIYWLRKTSYSVKTLYDLTKISAELRYKYKGEKSIISVLKTLNAYQKLLDPFSGKPYKYDSHKKLLYGFGPNLIDDKGKKRFEWREDIVIPLTVTTSLAEQE